MKRYALLVLPAVCLVLSAGHFAVAAETAAVETWSRFYGEGRDGIVPNADVSTDWGEDGPEVLWSKEIGRGYSNPSFADGRAFVIGNADNKDTVYCLDAASGEEKWSQQYPCSGGQHPGPRCSPTVHEGRVYTLSIQGHLFCWDAESGERQWSHDARKDFGGKPGGWGFACSPLVLGDRLIVDVGPVVALDLKTGKPAWKSEPYKAGYSSPVPFEHDGETRLAIFNATGLVILDPADGKEIASFKWKTAYDVNASMPVVSGNRIFITSGYGTGCALVEFNGEELKQVYRSKVMGSHFSTPILWEGDLYGHDGNVGGGSMKCIEFATGKEKWTTRGSGSFIVVGGKLVMLGSRGDLEVAKLSPESWAPLAKTRLGGGKWWNIPVFNDGRLYCRSHEGKLVCLDVGAE